MFWNCYFSPISLSVSLSHCIFLFFSSNCLAVIAVHMGTIDSVSVRASFRCTQNAIHTDVRENEWMKSSHIFRSGFPPNSPSQWMCSNEREYLYYVLRGPYHRWWDEIGRAWTVCIVCHASLVSNVNRPHLWTREVILALNVHSHKSDAPNNWCRSTVISQKWNTWCHDRHKKWKRQRSYSDKEHM